MRKSELSPQSHDFGNFWEEPGLETQSRASNQERPLGVDKKQSPSIAVKGAKTGSQDFRAVLLSFFPHLVN